MQDVEVESIMRTMVDAVQTYDQVTEVRSSCRASFGLLLSIVTLDPQPATAPLPDSTVQRWPASPKFRAISSAGGGARSDR